jgi:hypothetical protein
MRRVKIDEEMDRLVVKWTNEHMKMQRSNAVEYTCDTWRILLTNHVPSALLVPLRQMFIHSYPETEKELTWV